MAENALIPQITTPEAAPNSVPDLRLISLDDIDATDRLRPIDQDAAAAIAASMAKDGLINAISVCRLVKQKSGKPYRLVCGGHRFAAAKLLGWTDIKAELTSADALARKSLEIAENFFRADMSPIDQARFVSELIETEKARLGISAQQDGRANNKRKISVKEQLDNDLCIVHKSFGLQEVVAAKLGLHRATVSRHLVLNGLSPHVAERVRSLSIAGNASALRKLAGQEPTVQHRIVELIVTGRAKGVNDALAIIQKKVAPSQQEKHAAAFLGAWSRLGLAERKAALRELALQTMPKGFQIITDIKPANDLTPDEVAEHSEIMAFVRKGAAE